MKNQLKIIQYQDWSIQNGNYNYPGGLRHMKEDAPEQYKEYCKHSMPLFEDRTPEQHRLVEKMEEEGLLYQ